MTAKRYEPPRVFIQGPVLPATTLQWFDTLGEPERALYGGLLLDMYCRVADMQLTGLNIYMIMSIRQSKDKYQWLFKMQDYPSQYFSDDELENMFEKAHAWLVELQQWWLSIKQIGGEDEPLDEDIPF